MLVIQGLRRHPDNAEAVDTLLHWYGVEVPRPGLEKDVIDALKLQPDADDLMSTMVDNLRHLGHGSIASSLMEHGKLAGLRYVPAPPETTSSGGESTASKAPHEQSSVDRSVPGEESLSDQTVDGMPIAKTRKPGTPAMLDELPGDDERDESENDDAVVEGNNSHDEQAPARDLAEPTDPLDSSHGSHEPVDEGVGARTRRGRATIFLAIGAVVAAFLAYQGWEIARRATLSARVDAAFATYDPLNSSPWRDAVADGVAAFPRDREYQELQSFAQALSAEGVDGMPTELSEDPTSRWGLAANGVAAIAAREWEPALREAKRLSLLYPDAPLADWLYVRIYEARGELEQASKVNAGLLSEHSSFAAGVLASVRIAVKRNDAEALTAALDKLEKLDAEHPYLVLRRVELPDVSSYFGPLAPPTGSPPPGEEELEGDKFLLAARSLVRSIDAFERGHLEVAQRSSELAMTVEPHLSPAILLASTLQAAEGDTKTAEESVRGLDQISGLDRDFRTLAQAVIPFALSYAGRPDLAMDFTAPAGDSNVRANRPRSLRFPADADSPAYIWATLARAATFNELGEPERAVKVCEMGASLGREADVFRFAAYLIEEQGGATTELGKPASEDALAAFEAVSAFFDGDNAAVISEAQKIPDDSVYQPMVSRFVAQAHLARRQTGAALNTLDSIRVSLVESVFLNGSRLRALSRLGKGNRKYTVLRDRLSRANPVGVNRTTDLAFGAFWQGEAIRATELVENALQRNENHRQANWLMGLLLRTRGEFSASQKYLKRSGRDYDGNPDVLLEIGYANAELGNWDEARRMFHKSMLLDRENLDAIEGLGHAYSKLDSEVGIRDLERMLSGYPSTTRFSAQRGELLEWLAVLSGLEKGAEDSLSYLDRAEELVGRRADMLVARATYHEAREEFKKARQLYAEALRRDSTNSRAHLGLARCALHDEEPKIAVDHLRRYIELEPRGEHRAWAAQELAKIQ